MADTTIRAARPSLDESASHSVPASKSWVAAATVIGTTIEWYDFFIYGTAAALIFNKLFFPSFDTTAGTLAAFGTFAIGLFARPFGALAFGHFGDRVGRKSMLMLSLFLMGVPTVLIGLVPTYDQIGIWAAVALVILRILQGIALGGEWGGAVLMAVEHAPKGRRSLFGSLPQAGVPLGLLLSTGAFTLVSLLPEQDLLSWGWRIPFLASFVLIAVGVLVRSKVTESPAFNEVKRNGLTVALPAAQVFGRHWKSLALAVGSKLAEVTLFYIVTIFVLSYATSKLGMPRPSVLNAIMLASVVAFITIPLFGWIGDRIGQRTIYAAGGFLLAVFAIPFFMLVETRETVFLTCGIVLALGIFYPMMYGPQPGLLSAQFPPEVRYSGISLGVQIAGAIGGGLAPIIATGLLARYGTTSSIGYYIMALGILAALCASLMRPVAQDEP